jgi:hypothetical protein
MVEELVGYALHTTKEKVGSAHPAGGILKSVKSVGEIIHNGAQEYVCS